MQQPNHGGAYELRIDTAGRVVIPAAPRKEAGIHEGDTLVFISTRTGLEIKTLWLGSAQSRRATTRDHLRPTTRHCPPVRIESEKSRILVRCADT